MTPLTLLFLLGGGWATIPPGEYRVGCEPKESCPERESPRVVRVGKPLEVMKTEVPVDAFARFVKETGYLTMAEEQGLPFTWRKARAYKVEPGMPVAHVTLRDAAAYCKWAGARLPTESEWTVASRAAGEPSQGFLWWQTDARRVWSRETSGGRPHDVGKLLPNGWGLHDMEGNVWELTMADRPEDKTQAMVRGGGWITCQIIEGRPEKNPPADNGRFTRCAWSGELVRDDIGFRCVRVRSRD